MDIRKTSLPKLSQLNTTDFDYSDSYQANLMKSEFNINEAGKAFFTSAPKWTATLFELRNRIVKVFGLKTSETPANHQELLDNFNCEPGERLGLFEVFYKDENEVILGEDDKHLDFRISFLKNQSTLTLSTTVIFKNSFGKIYFALIKPFHNTISKRMLKGIIKQLS